MHTSPYFDTCMWEVWQYCAASLAVLQYEEAGRRYPGTGRTGHEYSSTDTWPYHSVSPCQVWQYGADFLMYPSIASHSSRTDTLYPTCPCPLKLSAEQGRTLHKDSVRCWPGASAWLALRCQARHSRHRQLRTNPNASFASSLFAVSPPLSDAATISMTTAFVNG